MTACASDLTLDEWSAGELDRDASARLSAHLDGCPHCRQRHAGFEAMRASFLKDAPSFQVHREKFGPAPAPSVRVRELRSRRRQKKRELLQLVAASFATLSAAAAAVVLLARAPLEGEEVRTKGSAHVDFYVKRGGVVKPGVRGEQVAPGDALRFTYTHPHASYLALFNLDARRASVYFPASVQAVKVAAGTQVPLDFSVELDRELGIENVYALFCPQPFQVEPLRAALAAERRLPVPPACQLDVITLEKVAAR